MTPRAIKPPLKLGSFVWVRPGAERFYKDEISNPAVHFVVAKIKRAGVYVTNENGVEFVMPQGDYVLVDPAVRKAEQEQDERDAELLDREDAINSDRKRLATQNKRGV
jgi:hypothetical protein